MVGKDKGVYILMDILGSFLLMGWGSDWVFFSGEGVMEMRVGSIMGPFKTFGFREGG